jgi:putative ATP-dependent endonuclease of OLD family
MNCITEIKLSNFKRFRNFSVSVDPKLNLFIGDNESGKSTLLLAIDLTISGSRYKVEQLGLEHLFNTECIIAFLKSDRKYFNLPQVTIELYFNDEPNEFLNGKNNTLRQERNGIKLVCAPNGEYSKVISDILKDPNCIFPFEFYSIEFTTFAGNPYNSHTKSLKHILIDNSQINSEYAMNTYIKEIYQSTISGLSEKFTHQHQYRLSKNGFKNNSLNDINERLLKIGQYSFGIKSNSKSNLETDLTIYDGDVTIENKGKGRQCIIKTQLALTKNHNDLEVVLLEEPENHLSHLNMQMLIKKIAESDDKQIFIATHSNAISSRLDLRHCILINSNSTVPIKLDGIGSSTANYFMKAPDQNLLQFILSRKVILVEGDAEYILLEAFYNKAMNQDLKANGICILSVDGTSFKRYLNIAIHLKIKTAVITDNDKDYKANIVENYSVYTQSNIKIFSDLDDSRSTFEMCVYNDNQKACDDLFQAGRKSLTVMEYMLKNKTKAALTLLETENTNLNCPQYISEAFQWITKN